MHATLIYPRLTIVIQVGVVGVRGGLQISSPRFESGPRLHTGGLPMKDADLEIAISKAILESYAEDLLRSLDVDVAVVGAGPSGMTAAYFLAKGGAKTVVFERGLSVGGGMWGGGMMFSRIASRRGREASSYRERSPPASRK